ncbi:MAG: hypothetical protein KJP00_05000 [Bacteroidia bacterium]|nr:hypothetical protein [Bacteroidia bacterium]
MKTEKLLSLGFILIIVAGCFITRTINLNSTIFPSEDEVRLLGVDPYFYLRQAETAVQNYPKISKVDHGTHYPNGVYSDLTGFYTVFNATLIKLVDVFYDHPQIEAKVLAYIPVILGCMIGLLLFLIGSKLFSIYHGFSIGLLYLFFPGLSLPRSVLGFSDHHVVEIVLSLWIIYSLIHLFKESFSFKNGILASIPLVIFFTCWNGSPLYVILYAFTLLLINTVLIYHNYKINNYAKRFGVYGISAGLQLFILHLFWPEIIVLFDTRITFQVILVLLVLGVLGPTQLYVAKFLKKYITNHKIIAFGLFGFGLVISYLVFNNTNVGVRAIQMMNMQATNLVENAVIDYTRFFKINEAAGYFGLFGIVVSGLAGFIRKEFRALSLTTVFSGFFVWMWLNTFDMGYMVSPYMCLMSIIGISVIICFLEDFVGEKIKQYSNYSIIGISIILILSKFAITSNNQYYFTEQSIRQGIIYQEGWYSAADWIRENTPQIDNPINEFLDDEKRINGNVSYGENDYGIICAWDFGNIINQRAKRIPVWSRWPAAKVPKWMMSQSEQESLRNLCPDCEGHEKVKYAVVDARSNGTYFSSKANTAGLGLSAYNTQRQTNYGGRTINLFTFGSAFDNSIVNKLYAKDGNNLSHYRLIWDSPQYGFTSYISDGNTFERYDREMLTNEEHNYFSQNVETLGDGTGNRVFYQGYYGPWVKVFEIVKGAEVKGKFQPNASLNIILELQSNTSNRTIVYTKTVECDDTGKFSTRVPYATDQLSEDLSIKAQGNYRLNHGNDTLGSFDITNDDIIAGNTIEVYSK